MSHTTMFMPASTVASSSRTSSPMAEVTTSFTESTPSASQYRTTAPSGGFSASYTSPLNGQPPKRKR